MIKFLLLSFLFTTIALAKNYPLSDHYDGKVFFNPQNHTLKSFWEVLVWKWTADQAEWPESVPNTNYPLPKLQDQGGLLTFINHASFLLQLPGISLITDPIFSDRASPVTFAGPKRVRPPGQTLEILPPIDVVLVSHNHYDHLDIESLVQLDKKYQPLFLVPLGNAELLLKAGIQNVKELDWWEEVKVKETRIVFTPSHHWSARTLFDKCETLWGSFFIEHLGKKVYFAGDTGAGPHFRDIKVRLGSPDISLLPIGAYEPRWFMKYHHVNPEEAVEAHLQLESALSFGMHFGTFQLTDESYDQPVKDLKEALEKMKVDSNRFRILDFGETFVF